MYLLAFSFITICFSCSQNEEMVENTKYSSSMQEIFNASKSSTELHNDMLENMYGTLVANHVNFKNNLVKDEKELDSCIQLFVAANKAIMTDVVNTRSRGERDNTVSFLKLAVLDNPAFVGVGKATRSNLEQEEYPDFLLLFYNDFFKSDSLEIDELDDEVLKSIHKVMDKYPSLTEEELSGLMFVAGVTYNSCLYWYENAEKWIKAFNLKAKAQTRANWLWDGVKNGVKKWAKADGGGALRVWTANKIAGIVSGGTALLGGAAVGSVVGAWKNLPIWDYNIKAQEDDSDKLLYNNKDLLIPDSLISDSLLRILQSENF